MKHIASDDNQKLKLIRKLSSKKNRDAAGRFVIEGGNLLEEALERGAGLEYVILSDDYHGAQLIDKLCSMSVDTYTVSRNTFEKLTDAENGVGVIAVCRKPDNSGAADAIRAEDNILVLDRVQDPGNIGTMIRTAVAAGYAMVVMTKGTADVYSPKVLRATAGMIFDIPLLYVKSTEELETLLRSMGKSICVTEPAHGIPYYEAHLDSGIALVIGNEGNGVSREVIDMADRRINIPMRGNIESLNAAISAAILMYEAVRTKRN